MNHKKIIKETHSVCPVCLKKINARVVELNGDTYIEKTCSVHGEFSAVIWRGLPKYEQWGIGQEGFGPEQSLKEAKQGCPYDCGLCTDHKSETCTVLMEVTSDCNMKCPVCFAQANESKREIQPDLSELKEMLEAIIASGGPFPLQLSGGEPTVREDLPEIIEVAKEMGFKHVQVNTNGLKLAEDPAYAKTLKKSGLDLIYLQFDGVTDDVYQITRGRDLVDIKEKAIEHCMNAKLAVQLVPVVIPKVNDHQIGAIIDYAKKWMPLVKGVHFQPVSYFGRFPEQPKNETRITLPEVIQLMEVQTKGEIKVSNFPPRKRKDSHCGFSGFFILDDADVLRSTTTFSSENSNLLRFDNRVKTNPSQHVRNFIEKKSVYVEEETCACTSANNAVKATKSGVVASRSKTHYLSISGMPFQDAWTLDLDRLEGCCVHVMDRKTKTMIPFCSKYLTSIDGKELR